MATRRAALPITGPKGDARSRLQAAVGALRGRDAEKMRAAERDPNIDTFAQTANGVKQRGHDDWVTDHRDTVLGTKRTT